MITKDLIMVLSECQSQDEIELKFMKLAYLLKISPDELYKRIKKDIEHELDQKLKLFW